jgi:hypothetical protein
MMESAIATPAPSPRSPVASAPPKKSALSLPIIVGGLVVLGCIGIGGIYLVTRLLGIGGPANPATEAPLVLAANTDAPTATTLPEETALPEETPTPSFTETPIATATPDGPYVVITDIRLEAGVYVVDYDVHNFPDGANLHVHIYFNNIPQEQAGSPGSGPWKLTWGSYGNPPFTQYIVSARPSDATQMCAVVANPNHSIQLNTGNCVDLPE